ncbi:MAG: response regulator [Proteobacteria bacterium]|nr:response regulator [Pseudomonadota bacterium]
MSGHLNTLMGALDSLAPPSFFARGPELAYRTRALLWSSMSIGVCVLGLGLSILPVAAWLGGLEIGMGVAFCVLPLLLLRATLSVTPPLHVLLVGILVNLLFLSSALGEPSTIVALALAVLPLVALLIAGIPGGLVWLSACAGAWLILYEGSWTALLADWRLDSAAAAQIETGITVFYLVGLVTLGVAFEATRRRTLGDLDSARAELEQNDRDLRQFMDALPALINFIDAHERYVFVNSAFERLHDRPRDEIEGQPLSTILPPHVYADIQPQIQRALEGKEVRFESEFPMAEGSPWYFSTTYVPKRSSSGEVLGFYSLSFNVSRQVYAERERRALEAKVLQAQKLESLGVLAGGIAHDFNNLLVAVLGNAELALSQLAPTSAAREELEQIHAASVRAAELCKQMLAYSGKARFVIEDVDLAEIAREMTQLLEISISKNVELVYDFADGLLPVRADATQVRQVLMNLITNASEAMEGRRGVITISTGGMDADVDYLAQTYVDDNLEPGRYAYLQVRDTGCGMDEDTLNSIFDPFFSTKFTGRGLGLAAVLGIVRGHRGAIRVESQRDVGTVIRVLFPVSAESAADVRAPEADADDAWVGSGTVLVVDDEATVRRVTAKMLDSTGFKVILASDGAEALNIVADDTNQISAVILDMTMPRMDGEETFRELQRLRPNLPVILSSGFSEQDATRRFTSVGLAGFLQKPYSVNALLEKLRAAVG